MKPYKSLLVVFFAAVITQPVFAQLKPGDVAPNAKVIDAVDLFPFNMGVAIVRKGSAYGLIDIEGNFIVPYNKYKNIAPLHYTDASSSPGSGIFLLDTELGAINSKGKLITAAYPTYRWSVGSDDGKLIKAFEKPLYMDAEGHQYILKQYLEDIVDGIGIVKAEYKCGYKNLKDEWIVKPIYDYAEPFSEGMACVAKRNEFGEIKWGFIDKTGKEVIGLVYSFKPENFHAGLARVQPKDITQFLSAYIDKNGSIAQKFNKVAFYTYIGNGLYSGEGNIMDSTGKLIPVKEFLQQLGIVAQPGDRSVNLGIENVEGKPYNDGKISFTRPSKESGHQNYGSVDIKTKAAIEGMFDAASTFHYFDPISKLAFARFYLNKDYKDKTPPREGYVNEQGVFVIIKGEASKW